jgi:ribonuclease J
MSRPKLKLIPLGGLGEIGKNMMLLEYGDDILIIDCGLMFPEEDMLGIDLVIPDLGYVVENRDKIRGIVITHGHEDHIGALPYLLPQINKVPIYSTRLTQGLIMVKLRERRIKDAADLKVLEFGEEETLGNFKIELFPVCHSIPDAAGIIVTTPEGIVVHSGDSGSAAAAFRFYLRRASRIYALGTDSRRFAGECHRQRPGKSGGYYVFFPDFAHSAGYRCRR